MGILIFQVLIFVVSLVFTVRLAYLCTAAIPTDILVSKQRELEQLNEIFRPVWDDTGEPMDLHCSICNAYVQESTKHCGPCNRCCENFDHHCKWLNNCIGTENYSIFRRLINAYLIFTLSSLLLFVHAKVTGVYDDTKTVEILMWI